MANKHVILRDVALAEVNPASEESLVLLRKIVKLLESSATTDSSQRQRITLDAITGSLTLGTISTITNAVPVGNVATLASVDGRYQFLDQARNVYANGIRANLAWTDWS